MKKRFVSTLLTMFTVAFLFAPSIFARQIAGCDFVLPRVGAATRGRLTKINASAAVNNNSTIGGGKNLNTAIRSTYNNADITPTYNLSSGNRILMDYNGGGRHYVNTNTTLALASQFGNLVRIHTAGTWSPDQW